MLHYGELTDVLDNYCEVGMYDPKSGTNEEITVINLFFTESSAGRDLKSFIDFMPFEIIDVTVEESLTDGKYKIFIELENNDELFTKICRVLKDCSGLAGIKEWNVKVYRKEPRTITVESLNELVGTKAPKLTTGKDDEDE